MAAFSASAVTAVAAVGVAAVAAGAATAIAFGKMAAEAEMVSVKLRVMLKSGDAAAAMVKDLGKFAASTPFKKMELGNAAQALLGVKVSGRQIIPTLKKIGDVAALSGNAIGEVTQIYAKIQSKGKAQAEELNQLIERRIPIMDGLSTVMGKSSEDIRKLASDGKVSAATISQAFDVMTQKGGIFENGMAELSKTTTGKFSTMKDNFTAIAEGFGATLLPAAKGFFDGATNAAQAFMDYMKPYWKSIETIVTSTWQVMDAAGDAAWAAIESAAKGFMTTFNEQAITFDDITLGMVSALATVETAFELAAIGADRFFSKLGEIAGMVSFMAPGLDLLAGQVVKIADGAMNDAGNVFGGMVQGKIDERMGAIRDLREKNAAAQFDKDFNVGIHKVKPSVKIPGEVSETIANELNKIVSDSFGGAFGGGLGGLGERFKDSIFNDPGPHDLDAKTPSAEDATGAGKTGRTQFTGAIQGDDAYALLVRAMGGGGKTPEKQLTETKKTNVILKSVKTAMDKAGDAWADVKMQGAV